jgi:hypothetical protein
MMPSGAVFNWQMLQALDSRLQEVLTLDMRRQHQVDELPCLAGIVAFIILSVIIVFCDDLMRCLFRSALSLHLQITLFRCCWRRWFLIELIILRIPSLDLTFACSRRCLTFRPHQTCRCVMCDV